MKDKETVGARLHVPLLGQRSLARGPCAASVHSISDNVNAHTMKTPKLTPPEELVEALAEIEHEQWVHWSQTVAGEVSAVTRDKWRRSWVAYAELTDEVKETDRVWARKVTTLLRRRRLIP